MENEEKVKQIDLRLVFKRIREHKKLFFITLPIVIALSSYIILCVPRTYTSETDMAPEMNRRYCIFVWLRFTNRKEYRCHFSIVVSRFDEG